MRKGQTTKQPEILQRAKREKRFSNSQNPIGNRKRRHHERQGAPPGAEEVHGQAGPPQDQREPRRRGDPPRLRPLHEPRPRRDDRVHKGKVRIVTLITIYRSSQFPSKYYS